jgi:hypothetical protein
VGNGYSVLLAVCSAICPASFGCVLPICMGQNILNNESIIFRDKPIGASPRRDYRSD